MERKNVVSSNLKSIGYDPSLSILEIEFKNKLVYQYYKVPERVYKELLSAPSKGSYHIRYIKNVYKYKQIK